MDDDCEWRIGKGMKTIAGGLLENKWVTQEAYRSLRQH
jgi:hypothetical protein